MRVGLTAALAAALAQAASAQPAAGDDARAAEMMKRYESRTKIYKPCPVGAPGEVVVCATVDDHGARYRLPLPEEREGADGGGPIKGERPRASAAPSRQGSCGVVGHDGYGCNGGVSMKGALSWVAKLMTVVADPDADVEAPTKIPERYNGAGAH